MDERVLARHRLHHRDSPPLGEIGELGDGTRVVDAASGDDERSFGGRQHPDRADHIPLIWSRSTNVVELLVEERGRKVISLALDVLGESEENGPAIGRVEHDGERLWERPDDLLGGDDPIPVPRDRLERITHRQRRIVEVFDLLEDGVGDAICKIVAAEEEERQAIGMGNRGRCDHVR